MQLYWRKGQIVCSDVGLRSNLMKSVLTWIQSWTKQSMSWGQIICSSSTTIYSGRWSDNARVFKVRPHYSPEPSESRCSLLTRRQGKSAPGIGALTGKKQTNKQSTDDTCQLAAKATCHGNHPIFFSDVRPTCQADHHHHHQADEETVGVKY